MSTLELTLQHKKGASYPIVANLIDSGDLPLRYENTFSVDLTSLDHLQFEYQKYGAALGKALFRDNIRDAFIQALASGKTMRVLLSIEDPDLRPLHWHRLLAPIDGKWRFLAINQRTPFSLEIPSPASTHFPVIGRRDLRALLLVAAPDALSGSYPLAPFDTPTTIDNLREAMGDIPSDALEIPTLDALCDALTAKHYTILHIVCHAMVIEGGETILYFPKNNDRKPTPASDMISRLNNLKILPYFTFLAACESAAPHAESGLGSLASRLVRDLGMPAVVAMTDRISILSTQQMVKPFYTQLYKHGHPDLALAESLASLQGKHDLTVPALFSRLGSRSLFSDTVERNLRDADIDYGLTRLRELFTDRAPVLSPTLETITIRLRATMGVAFSALSNASRNEREEALKDLNKLSLEVIDLSFDALCIGQDPPAYDARSPFRGLEYFRPEDSVFFFGREKLVDRLIHKLNDSNFLVVLGASGSGKSSLVMAGLLPELFGPSNQEHKSVQKYIPIPGIDYILVRPGNDPVSNLKRALTRGAENALLVVDQFEELFTLTKGEQRGVFISLLLEQVKKRRVILVMRADFLGEVALFPSLKDQVESHQAIIPPMDGIELRHAMKRQAAQVNLRFESDLDQQILDDVIGEPGAMPLLQHALWTLWKHRHGRWLRADEYHAFGGVRQAIASTAEDVYDHSSEIERERLRDIFLRLTRLDESSEGRDTRRRILLSDLIPAGSDPMTTTLLVKALADARLIVVTGNEVEVAHETLIWHWNRLKGWLSEDREHVLLHRQLSDRAKTWQEGGQESGELLRGQRLRQTWEWAEQNRDRLNILEQDYLDQSHAFAQIELCEKEELQRKKQEQVYSERARRKRNLSELGWGVIFAPNTTQEIRDALQELLSHRQRQTNQIYNGFYHEFIYQPGDKVEDFLVRNGVGFNQIEPEKIPYYLLLVGAPDQISFEFQYELDIQYAVGRIDFETVEEYRSYARSVVDSESGNIILDKRIAIWTPRQNLDRATQLTADKLALPLSQELANQDWDIRLYRSTDATKTCLQNLISGNEVPAILFTSSHGMGVPPGHKDQLCTQGALLCQDYSGFGTISPSHYFASQDIPDNTNLTGRIAFLWSCYSAGVPQYDNFSFPRPPKERNKNLENIREIAPYPFLSSLPKKLLSLGMLAIIGKVERMWGYSLTAHDSELKNVQIPDIASFKQTLQRLMSGHTVGSAVEPFRQRTNLLTARFSEEMRRIMFDGKDRDENLNNRRIQSIDARNHIIIGDPAVYVPVA